MPVRRDSRTGGWYFRTTVKRPDGKRVRLFGTPGVPGPFHDLPCTKVGATEAERRAIAGVLTGSSAATSAVTKEANESKTENEATIREHATTFLETYLPNGKPSEKRCKRNTLHNHLLPVFGDMTIGELGQAKVNAFAGAELKRGMTVKTVNNRLAVLSTLIKYVTGEKSKLRFKLAGMASEVAAVSSDDVEKLLVAAGDERYRVAILLASEAGLRIGEIRGLQWTDVKDGQVTVRRALDVVTNEPLPPKHDKVRAVPLSPRIVAALATLPRRGIWIVSRLDGESLGYWGMIEAVHAIYDRAGVDRPRNAMHCLRHTFGTVMAKRVPLPVLQKLMGHADVQTTLRYVDVNEDDKRDAIALVFGTESPAVAATWQRRSGK